MDDVTPPIPPLPDDPAALRQMIRQQQAGVVTLLKQRQAAEQGQAQLQQRHGELEHEHGELQRRYAELTQERDHRIAELTKERDRKIAEMQKERDARIAELAQERDRVVAELKQTQAELELEKLRLAHQLDLLKKHYYGPRADRVDLGQLLLEFGQELEAGRDAFKRRTLDPATAYADALSLLRR